LLGKKRAAVATTGQAMGAALAHCHPAAPPDLSGFSQPLTAQELKRYMDPIYYCATGVELEVGLSVSRKNDRRIPAATKI
jgi:hypothetical protein